MKTKRRINPTALGPQAQRRVRRERRKTEVDRRRERINHPNHYGGDTIYEAVKVIEAWGLNFNTGNAAKYVSRAGKKDPARVLEDLEKAIWYLQREVKLLKKIKPCRWCQSLDHETKVHQAMFPEDQP